MDRSRGKWGRYVEQDLRSDLRVFAPELQFSQDDERRRTSHPSCLAHRHIRRMPRLRERVRVRLARNARRNAEFSATVNRSTSSRYKERGVAKLHLFGCPTPIAQAIRVGTPVLHFPPAISSNSFSYLRNSPTFRTYSVNAGITFSTNAFVRAGSRRAATINSS